MPKAPSAPPAGARPPGDGAGIAGEAHASTSLAATQSAPKDDEEQARIHRADSGPLLHRAGGAAVPESAQGRGLASVPGVPVAVAEQVSVAVAGAAGMRLSSHGDVVTASRQPAATSPAAFR